MPKNAVLRNNCLILLDTFPQTEGAEHFWISYKGLTFKNYPLQLKKQRNFI